MFSSTPSQLFTNMSHSSALADIQSPTTQAKSSKAVLAALRTLQDKIRRLEADRAEALREASDVRAQLNQQEIEAEQLKQRDVSVAQKNLVDARSAFDRLVSEKTELDIKIARMDDRNKEAQRMSSDLSEKIRSIEQKKQEGAAKLQELETNHRHLEAQIQHVHEKEKELEQTIAWETKRHEDEMSGINSDLKSLQVELSKAVSEKHFHDAKLLELDELVGQLLAVNGALVAQLTGKPSPKSSAAAAINNQANRESAVSTPISQARPAPQKSVVVPRVAFEKTRATELGKREKFVDKNVEKRLGNKSSTSALKGKAQNLKEMHSMYTDIVRDIDMNDSLGDDDDDQDDDGNEQDEKEEMRSTRFSSDHMGEVSLPSTVHDLVRKAAQLNSEVAALQEKSRSTVHAAPPPPPQVSQAPIRSWSHTGEDQDLQKAISSLEQEFKVLDREYAHVIGKDGAFNAQATDELLDVIEKMHKKGVQLRNLRSPDK